MLAAPLSLQYLGKMTERMTAQRAFDAARSADDGVYSVMMEHGTMELGYYCPIGTDPQQPHTQDELYIVHAGTGTFLRGDERIPFAPGDALFVAAGVDHRFVDFSEDIALWVVFYGAEGGESAT